MDKDRPVSAENSPTEASEAGEIGRRIRRLRLSLHLRPYNLGTAIGIRNTGYIKRIEAGQLLPSITTLARIARTLGVATSDLMPSEPFVPLSVSLLRAHGLTEDEAEELLRRFRAAEAEIRSRRNASRGEDTSG